MCKYSIISISKQENNFVSGYWLQDCIGTLDDAKKVAISTSEINHKSIIGIVDEVNSTTPGLRFFTELNLIWRT